MMKKYLILVLFFSNLCFSMTNEDEKAVQEKIAQLQKWDVFELRKKGLELMEENPMMYGFMSEKDKLELELIRKNKKENYLTSQEGATE